ncbi:hypothetical protein GQX74_005876 [Glossina fuscipes]|nr:hypothetical protein GQX74_005876 [Glossina fuscipes]
MFNQMFIEPPATQRGLHVDVDGLAEVANPASKGFVGFFLGLNSLSRTPSGRRGLSVAHSNCSEGTVILNDEILCGCVTLILKTMNLLNSKNGSFEVTLCCLFHEGVRSYSKEKTDLQGRTSTSSRSAKSVAEDWKTVVSNDTAVDIPYGLLCCRLEPAQIVGHKLNKHNLSPCSPKKSEIIKVILSASSNHRVVADDSTSLEKLIEDVRTEELTSEIRDNLNCMYLSIINTTRNISRRFPTLGGSINCAHDYSRPQLIFNGLSGTSRCNNACLSARHVRPRQGSRQHHQLDLTI